jgi:hypothetical protein
MYWYNIECFWFIFNGIIENLSDYQSGKQCYLAYKSKAQYNLLIHTYSHNWKLLYYAAMFVYRGRVQKPVGT